MQGIDDASFSIIKSTLEEVIANATNSSTSSVEAAFIGVLSSSKKRDLSMYDLLTNLYTRSNDDIAIIKVYFSHINIDEEIGLLGKVNDTDTFVSEINGELQEIDEFPKNKSVLSISEMERIIGIFLCLILSELVLYITSQYIILHYMEYITFLYIAQF